MTYKSRMELFVITTILFIVIITMSIVTLLWLSLPAEILALFVR